MRKPRGMVLTLLQVHSELLPNKPMHQTGALVLKESIVFVRSLVPCHGRYRGRSLRSRLQVMGGTVRQTQPAWSRCDKRLVVLGCAAGETAGGP